MGEGPLDSLALHYRQSHARALALVARLSDEEVAWRPAPWAPSIGWNLWQMARSADRLQASLAPFAGPPSPGRLIWESDGLADRWGLDPDPSVGDPSGMPHRAAPALPGKGDLLDYAHRAFAAAERSLEAVVARRELARAGRAPSARPAGPGPAIVESLVQENRRLGEIESVRCLQAIP
jgi:hypothetical protein